MAETTSYAGGKGGEQPGELAAEEVYKVQR